MNMRTLQALAVVLLGAWRAQAKAVFAHFMVSNAANYTLTDWKNDINLAQTAHIQAFALNTAYNQGDDPQYALAFEAAGQEGFQLFFSFDYAGNGPWPKASVLSVLEAYAGNSQYYTYNGQPFVSTFEGPESAQDWISIKSQTGCFFVPDWSSLGAKAAMEQANGVADGLFSWAAWPWGNEDMTTFVDASYMQYLNGKPYMMPASPWFYTNLPGYDKNWLWRGDDLWNDRWLQILYMQPEWVEIISWNDYGESHYIGPVRSNALGAMDVGRAPLDYVSGMPHDGWRQLLPFAIDMFLHNTTTITDEVLVVWHRMQPATACGAGGTTGNTASQLQLEFAPSDVVQDAVFFSAILTAPADVSVTIGGAAVQASWTGQPDGKGGVGRYHGRAAFGGNLGAVTVTISRGGVPLLTVSGASVTNECQNQLQNWNAWVGYDTASAASATTPESMDELVCTNGTSIPAFSGLCEFACNLGYCPLGACVCTRMGDQVPKPKALNINGYPAAGLNDNYGGLCSFDCNLGYCPDTACATVSAPLTTPTVSPFTPPACTGGEGSDPFPGLCSYACNFGFCPRNICTCTSQGALVEPPPVTEKVSASAEGNGYDDQGLCDFACQRGYCPYPCVKSDLAGSGPPVYIDQEIWSDPTPTVSCIPPCVIVLPPVTLSTPTTLEFPPLVTTITERWNNRSASTTTLTFTFPPVTTTVIPVFNINITQTGVAGVTYTVTPSILPSASTTIYPPTTTGTGTSSITPIVVWVTSTPRGTSTYPTLTSVPTQVVVASGGPPGPSCTRAGGCGGSECLILCNSCGILGCGGICPGCGPSICIGCGPDGHGGGGGGGGGGDPDCIGPGCDDDHPDDDCGDPVTATICTLVVSSTQVLTTPTTSWSTTTRTHCDTTVGCDVEGTTTTTTLTTSAPADPTYDPAQYYDAYDSGDYAAEQAVFTSIQAWYSSYTKNVDHTPSTTTTKSTPTKTAPAVACTSVWISFGYGWYGPGNNEVDYTVSIGGTPICVHYDACRCTQYADTTGCVHQDDLSPNGYSMQIDFSNPAEYAAFDLRYPDGSVLDARAELLWSGVDGDDQPCTNPGVDADCRVYNYSWTSGDC